MTDPIGRTLGSDPSADSGAKTEAGCRKMPRFVFELRDWQQAINPFKECAPSLSARFFHQPVTVFWCASSEDRISERDRDEEGGQAWR